MFNKIFLLSLVLFLVLQVRGVSIVNDEPPGIYTENITDSEGNIRTYTYIYTGDKTIPENPMDRNYETYYRGSDTTVLWIDRYHQNAISRRVAISGDGMNIFAGWYLNNERTSLYRSTGDEFPLWSYSMPLAGGVIDVASSDDANLMAAASSGAPFRLWKKNSSVPILTYEFPSGFSAGVCDVSNDGNVAVAAASDGSTGRIFAFNSNGDSLYAVDFTYDGGLYGVELNSDGSIAVISDYYVISVLENGTLRDTISNYGQVPAAVSADGNRIVKGDYNSYITLYEWDGSSYQQVWQDAIGNPWVVSVDISGDGSTIMAGTGYSDGITAMYDYSSSTPLWTYQGYGSYGAYVRGVALSDSGSLGVAASWGDTAQTGSFHVLTVHNRSSSTPILGVTRDNEPGSLMDCDISSDGENITAGGKAVHAYSWGNGGQVYSILVGSTPSLNAATESIDSPSRFVNVGDSINPTVTYKNYGDDTVSFAIFTTIEDSLGNVIYNSADSIIDIAPDEEVQKSFVPHWEPSGYNYYNLKTWCELSGDGYNGDDTLNMAIKCFHDAEAKDITIPFDETSINMEITPRASVYNNGSYTESFQAKMIIKDSSGTVFYSDSLDTPNISPEGEQSVNFNNFTPDSMGNYICELTVSVNDDINPNNNTSFKNTYVSYEIIYDDGEPEAYYIVGSTYENNKFAVRFTPTLNTPFFFTGGRIYVNSTTAFDYVQLCNDDAGLPDTIAPVRIDSNVGAYSAPGWAEFSFDSLQVDSLQDYWIVLHWAPSSPSTPGVGADNFSPHSRSWWYNLSNGWNNWTSHDWMVRLLQAPGAGGIFVDTDELPVRYKLYSGYPNPFREKTSIAFDLPNKSNCSIEVFDITGRKIKTLMNGVLKAGHYNLEWDGSDKDGRKVSNGIYFYRMKTDSFNEVKKVILIR